jgi:hypothetical protein
MWVIITLVILALVVAVVMLALKNKKQTEIKTEDLARKADIQKEVENASAHELKRAKRGDVVVFENASESFEDINLVVDRINTYESAKTGYSWIELGGQSGGKRLNVEYHEDDEPYITLDQAADLDLEDLGIDETFLANADEKQSKTVKFQYDGKTFRYQESGETIFRKDGKGSGEGYWSWDFSCEEDPSLALWVEKWEEEPFEVGLSRNLTPHSVKLYPVFSKFVF